MRKIVTVWLNPLRCKREFLSFRKSVIARVERPIVMRREFAHSHPIASGIMEQAGTPAAAANTEEQKVPSGEPMVVDADDSAKPNPQPTTADSAQMAVEREPRSTEKVEAPNPQPTPVDSDQPPADSAQMQVDKEPRSTEKAGAQEPTAADHSQAESALMNVDKESGSTEKLEDDEEFQDAVSDDKKPEEPSTQPEIPEQEMKPQPAPAEESKSTVEASSAERVHHPRKDIQCIADRYTSADRKKVDIVPLKEAIQQLRRENKSWTEVLAIVFGYRYDNEWRMKKVNSDEGFTFIDQKHYELLGDVILSYIQEVMVVKYNLVELMIPERTQGPKCNIFHSKDFFDNDKKCLLLIQGAGAVRAGQWARSVCINAKLTEGTVFPALDFAAANGFASIVFNPNFTHSQDTRQPIPGNDSMETHSRFVWKHYIRRCPAESLYIIAHSCGGMCTAALLETYEEEFVDRVKAVAFTDSVHGGIRCSRKGKEHIAKVSVDFVASHLPLKTFIHSARESYNGSVHVSSGHSKHEYTTGSAMPAIVEFFTEMMTTGRNQFLEGRSR